MSQQQALSILISAAKAELRSLNAYSAEWFDNPPESVKTRIANITQALATLGYANAPVTH